MKKVNFKWIRGDDISETLIFTHPDGSLFLLEGMQVDLHLQPDDAQAEIIKISTQNGGIIVSQNRLTLTLSHSLTQKVHWETAQLLAGYPQTEIESFYRQEKEALAWQADNNAPVPMISQIAEQRGVPLAILVEKIIEKSNQFAALAGAIIGQRQKFETQIFAAENVENLTALEQEIEQWTS